MPADVGAFFVPRSPSNSRQMPAKKNGCPSARLNQRKTTGLLVLRSGSAKADTGTMQRCSFLSLGFQQPLVVLRTFVTGALLFMNAGGGKPYRIVSTTRYPSRTTGDS